jgi:hypothetical protein
VAVEPSNVSEPADDNQSAFERFEDLTRRLLSVPKSELDARRKNDKPKRPRRTARRKS